MFTPKNNALHCYRIISKQHNVSRLSVGMFIWLFIPLIATLALAQTSVHRRLDVPEVFVCTKSSTL